MPEGESFHAEMIAGLERVIDRLTLIDNEFGVCVLRRAIALLKATDTQADLTERARACFVGEITAWIDNVIAALQSERAAEREKVAAFMLRNSIATGHGDTTDDLLTELQGYWDEREANAAEARRAAIEGCVKEVSKWVLDDGRDTGALKARLRLLASPAPQEETR